MDFKRDPDKIYLLIQHDVDNHPYFTKRMAIIESHYDIKSNIFIFKDRYTNRGIDESYIIDHNFFKELQDYGFVIGYHQNAFALSGFNMDKAIERYRNDVNYLRKFYDIQFVVPHGGIGRELNGTMVHNVDVPMPGEFQKVICVGCSTVTE